MICGTRKDNSSKIRTCDLELVCRFLFYGPSSSRSEVEDIRITQRGKEKNERKSRKEANTREIFLVVLQNEEEVNYQGTFICILWELMFILIWFIEEMLWTIWKFDRLRFINCYVKLVLLIFFSKTLSIKDPKRTQHSKKTNPSHWSRLPQNGSQRKLIGRKGIE